MHLVSENEWPPHLKDQIPRPEMTSDEIHNALFEFFKWGKGNGSLADLIEFCSEEEMPIFIKETINNIRATVYQTKQWREENGEENEVSSEQEETLE